jgi:predicted nucleotidyltransferase
MPPRNHTRMASNFLELLNQLHDSHVDFVIVGGVAAALHGGSRVTFDLDIVPSLIPESWTAEQIRRWRTEKGMLALNFRTPGGSTEVDLIVSEAEQFESLRDRAVQVTVEGRTFYVASINDLIAMKRRAGRPQDILDIAELQDIKKRLEN